MNQSLFNRREFLVYSLTGFSAIVFSFWISTQFSGKAFSQTPPTGVAPVPPPPAPGAPAAPLAPQPPPAPPAVIDTGSKGASPPNMGLPPAPIQDQGVKSTDSQILTFPGSPTTSSGTGESKIPELLSGIIEDYTYNPAGKRDPFTPIEKSNGSAMAGPIWPLQRYDLEQLKLVGIIWEVKIPKAMIMDPTGHGYVVTVNERIGRNNGYIARIREGEIVVVENIIGSDGKSAYVTKLMKLHPQ